jgi:hypothetical protein
MFDRRMIGVPNCPGKLVEVVDLPPGWSADSIAPRRQADLGHPILSYVTILSRYEAARINAEFKQQAEERLRTRLAEKGPGYLGQNIDQQAVHGGVAVDKLLEAIAQEGYFASWVVIEECTID